MKTYSIESYFNEWRSLVSFSCMRRGYAEGAFAMLKAMYNIKKEFRLIDSDGNIIDEWHSPKVKTSSNHKLTN